MDRENLLEEVENESTSSIELFFFLILINQFKFLHRDTVYRLYIDLM